MQGHDCWLGRLSPRAAFIWLALCGALVGCKPGDRADVVPVSGKVLLEGQPLKFGSITFQPMRGQPASGTIGPDGSFTLSTYRPGDGAAVGQHRVKITCYTSQDPAAKKDGPSESLGESLIPQQYTSSDTSGLTVAVLSGGNGPFVFELKSTPKEAESTQDGAPVKAGGESVTNAPAAPPTESNPGK
ncbi:MAG: hypothetical protein U0805_18025 [Pirellulales bacterium]